MSKRYSNKGHAARTAVQPQKDNTNKIFTWVILGIALVLVAAIAIPLLLSIDTMSMQVQNEIDSFEATDFAETQDVTNFVKITVKDYGDIVVRLRPDIAPISVENFQKLVKEGHYSDKIFHRVISGFMIQGGGVDTAGKEHEVDSIKGEFSSNGVKNDLKHLRGVISMARTSQSKDSASNQFYICHADSPHLNGEYAAFGYVLAGMDVVDAIAAVKTDGNDKPLTNVVIEKVTFVDPLK